MLVILEYFLKHLGIFFKLSLKLNVVKALVTM